MQIWSIITYEAFLKRAQIFKSIPKIAANLSKNLSKDKKGLFIDCGSNRGQGFTFFEQYFPLKTFDYILVEPNPFCKEELIKKINQKKQEGSIDLIAEAASTSEGTTKFYGLVEGNRGKTTEAASTLKEHVSSWYTHSEEDAITVDTFSLADFIRNKASLYKIIVVKMDIEGAEYDVLENLLKKGVHKKIATIFTEFHSQYMTEPDKTIYENREKVIIQSFKNDKIPFHLWI